MKNFCNKKCCLTCSHFAFWDGDYCCTSEMSIHQFGFNDDIFFNADIDNTMETPATCEDYEDRYFKSMTNMYMDEYKKWKAWDKLCNQLKAHVSDSSGIYEKITKPKYFNECNIIPKNLDEAIKRLDKELNEEDKKYLLEHGALSVHHSLGRWIRNSWKLWDDNSELKSYMKNIGCIHPDDMSNYIIEKFIEHLKHYE